MKPSKIKHKSREELEALFSRNFNIEAYEQAKKSIQEAMSNAKTFKELWASLRGYECDVEFSDKYEIILCEVELDRNNMETEADYVGVSFFIYWNDSTQQGRIETVELYSSETVTGEVEYLCTFHPTTYDIISTKQINW